MAYTIRSGWTLGYLKVVAYPTKEQGDYLFRLLSKTFITSVTDAISTKTNANRSSYVTNKDTTPSP